MNVQAAIISAITAATITLVMDVLLRPYLEVRKDRIVSAARDKRDLVVSLDISASHITSSAAINGPSQIQLREDIDTCTNHLALIARIRCPGKTRRVCHDAIYSVRSTLIVTLETIESGERITEIKENRDAIAGVARKLLRSQYSELFLMMVLVRGLLLIPPFKIRATHAHHRELKKVMDENKERIRSMANSSANPAT
ncbi:hypothetical protein [Amycolatopsis sp. NPDC051061]|uniref:hypothetical protein n=1 Tax=Amycolatopsis sp. NPDC051061 TaxID=3155042 RepID=UPI00341608A3